MGNISHTVGSDSNLVSFRSAARVPITSLKTSFLPKQDLHGYTKLWIGGTGKNLLQNTRTAGETTVFTAIFTTNSDGSVTVEGNPTNASGLTINKTVTLPAGTYILTGCPTGGGADTFSLIAGTVYDYGSGSTFTLNTETTLKVTISWVANASLDGLTFYPMIRLASNNDATWEPYENICPIEGWNNIEITHTGKNIFDAEHITHVSVNAWVNSGGTHQITPSNADRTFYIPCKPNTTYTITKALGDVLAGGYTTVLPATGVETYDYHRSYTTPTKSITIITGADAKYLAIWYYDSSKTYDKTVEPISLARTIQIEENNESTTYEQFQKNQTISVTFPVLGKNKFNWNVEQSYSSPTGSNLNTLRSFTPNTYVIGMSVNNYYRNNYTNWVLNPSVSNGTISFSSGSASGYGIAFPLELIPGQTYFLSGTGNGYAGATYYDKDGKVISFQNARLNKTITVPQEAVLTLIGFYTSATNTDYSFSNIQLELGTEATTYEEYNPDNTVYGGYIDIAKGEIVATYAYHTLDGTEARWTVNNSSNYKRAFTDSVRLGKVAKAKGKLYGSYTNSQGLWRGWISSSGSSSSCHILFYIPSEIDTVDKWTAYLTEHPLDICYELNEPIHYLLTKTQLQTLLNQNNIWSNTNGNTEVSYAIHDSASIRTARTQIAAAEPHIETNNIVSFNTDMIAPLKKAIINFEPIQEGSGDPSPSNIRPIKGFDFIKTTYCPNNLFPLGNHTRTQNGVTFTYYENGDVHIEGTATANAWINVPSSMYFTITPGTYRLGGNKIGSNVSVYLVVSTNNGGDLGWYVSNEIGSARTIDFTDSSTRVQIAVGSGKTVNTTIHPYLILEEEYNKMKKIEVLLIQGKNLFNEEYPNLSVNLQYLPYYVGDGAVIVSTDCPQNTNNYSNLFCIPGIVTTGASTGQTDIYAGLYRIITPIDGYITMVYRNVNGADPSQYHTMIERQVEGQTGPSVYESFQYTYGGYVDLVTGELVITHKNRVLNGSENDWGIYNHSTYGQTFWISQSDKKIEVSSSISNLYTNIDYCYGNQGKDKYNIFCDHEKLTRWYFRAPNDSITTLEEWKTWLSQNNINIIYELAIPITYQLTPKTLKTLRGQNNIWSNANGPIEVKYWTH